MLRKEKDEMNFKRLWYIMSKVFMDSCIYVTLFFMAVFLTYTSLEARYNSWYDRIDNMTITAIEYYDNGELVVYVPNKLSMVEYCIEYVITFDNIPDYVRLED